MGSCVSADMFVNFHLFMIVFPATLLLFYCVYFTKSEQAKPINYSDGEPEGFFVIHLFICIYFLITFIFPLFHGCFFKKSAKIRQP